jgi:hypothetical protein
MTTTDILSYAAQAALSELAKKFELAPCTQTSRSAS